MFLGIDLGTSGVKVLAVDGARNVLAVHTEPLTASLPHDGWSEQNPADWIKATATALDAVRGRIGAAMGGVRGIGLSGQMHGATLLDVSDMPLRPCILWNDTRSHREAALLDADERFRAVNGNVVFPGFTAPKMAWVERHEPEIFGRVAKILLPKDYLRLWLTGEFVSDMSDAAGTGWLDTGARDWSDELLDATGMTRTQVPRLVEGSSASAGLRERLAKRWGMRPGIVVAGGASDNAASAIGLGSVSAGDSFVSLGTSGVLFVTTDRFCPAPENAVHTFCHALPETWHQMGVVLSAASALGWLADILQTEPTTLSAELGRTVAAPGPITFLPYLSGERTPHNDPHLRGCFCGLSHATCRADLVRAVMEGVSFALRDCLAALRQAGSEPEKLVAAGGGSRSEYWMRLVATALNLPIGIPARGDFGAALGAARLACLAADATPVTECCGAPRIATVLEPDKGLSDAFDCAYERYTALRIAVRQT